MPVVPLDQAKAHLGIKDDRQDVELARFLAAAETRIAAEVGPLGPETVVERHHGGRDHLLLRRMPVIDVLSVAGPAGDVVDVTLLDVDLDEGRVWWPAGTGWGVFPVGAPRSLTVTYRVGRLTLPEDLDQAVKELLRHLWASQRGTGAGGARAAMMADAPEVTTGAGMAAYTLPYRVKQLIDPHRYAVAL